MSGAMRLGTGRVQVTAQVEDAETGAQLWAEHSDHAMGAPDGDPSPCRTRLLGAWRP